MTSRDDFMKGYRRDAVKGARLEAALASALRANPTQRLGQLLLNLCSTRAEGMWEIYDEDWIEMLEAAGGERSRDV
jgi:hypothetical protein